MLGFDMSDPGNGQYGNMLAFLRTIDGPTSVLWKWRKQDHFDKVYTAVPVDVKPNGRGVVFADVLDLASSLAIARREFASDELDGTKLYLIERTV